MIILLLNRQIFDNQLNIRQNFSNLLDSLCRLTLSLLCVVIVLIKLYYLIFLLSLLSLKG
jgi:hypothetical protein